MSLCSGVLRRGLYPHRGRGSGDAGGLLRLLWCREGVSVPSGNGECDILDCCIFLIYYDYSLTVNLRTLLFYLKHSDLRIEKKKKLLEYLFK